MDNGCYEIQWAWRGGEFRERFLYPKTMSKDEAETKAHPRANELRPKHPEAAGTHKAVAQ